MRIRKLWLDGYGRFSNRELELEPGLQVLLGPNEQGKSTTRSFVGDMLYGQKRSLQQRIYDDNHELRRPWNDAHSYGGRIMYELDSGRCYEVHRSFIPDEEFTRVYDASDSREITGDFEQLRNREFNFAEKHLGLSKDVFLSAATLSHLTLEGLGDADALVQIRERILSLADSGDEAGSAKAAVERLQARIARIGRPDLPKRPLPAARNRLQDLQKEYEEAFQHRARVAALETQRRGSLREEALLREQRVELERLVQTNELQERAQRLREAEALSSQIDGLTQRCFEMGSVRNFPLSSLPDVQRIEMRLSTAGSQLKRTQQSLKDLQQQLETEGSGAAPIDIVGAISEALEDRLAEVESKLKSLRERRTEVELDRAAAQQRLESLQKGLAALPDFSRVASDPVEWLTQLGASFTMALRVLEEETSRLRVCEEHAAKAASELRPLAPLFEGVEHLEAQIEEHETHARHLQEFVHEAARRAEEHRFYAEEYASSAPTNRFMAFLALVFMIVLGVAPSYTHNPGTYIPSLLCAVPLTYFLMNLATARRAANRAQAQSQEAERQVQVLQTENAEVARGVTALMQRGGCQTVRELEAQYDSYCECGRVAGDTMEACRRQQRVVDESRGQVEALFSKLTTTLQQVGERPRGHGDIPDALGRAIGRYQEYRDTKRRIADARDHLNHFDQHIKRLSAEADETRREEEEVSREIRRTMRANGYDEAKHDSTSGALRAYKVYVAELREQRGRTDLLRQQCEHLQRERQRDESELQSIQRDVSGILASAGVDSLEMWHELAALAREYQDLRAQLGVLEDRRNALLQGTSVESLRASVASSDAATSTSTTDTADLRGQVSRLSEQIEDRQNETRELEVMIASQVAGVRPISQIEEERGVLMRQVQELELELQAASYAIALIQEAAKDKHAHIAPPLAELASAYLGEITGGRYTMLTIGRGFEIHVQIPQRDAPERDVERRLSKGTVDQVYLALRLAMVRMLSKNGESIPMILDDPFANYDDERLERTMTLLVRIAQNHQILLFTCREDVATVGRALDVPVITL